MANKRNASRITFFIILGLIGLIITAGFFLYQELSPDQPTPASTPTMKVLPTFTRQPTETPEPPPIDTPIPTATPAATSTATVVNVPSPPWTPSPAPTLLTPTAQPGCVGVRGGTFYLIKPGDSLWSIWITEYCGVAWHAWLEAVKEMNDWITEPDLIHPTGETGHRLWLPLFEVK